MKQELTGHNLSEKSVITESSKRFAGQGNDYLRSIKFGFIRQRFASGSFWGRKTTAALFMFPVMASMVIGATQMVTQSFLVYLKYQALVDSYYH